ncbi:MAG TPA: hypothetical protein VJ456_07240, partial [Acidimicrobiia bacterium]|nr:hypothetical protein [Acidimicrobiia bacterium]
TTTSGDFDLVDYASPSVVWLTTNASNNKAHVTAGDCRGRLYTFSADDLAPGPVSAVGGENDCVLTVSAPVTPDGAAPGAPGSGLDRTLVMYVATTDPEGRSTRVHRLIQETSVTMRREPDNPPVLPGGAANALAVDAVVGPNGTLLPGGRVYVTTGRNLYVLDARYLTVVAKLVPGDDLVPGDTGFSRTTPSISGNLLFVSRDSGEQLVLDKRTLRPLPAGQFLAPASARPDAGSRAFGQPAVAGRTVVFGTGRGTFAYRARSAAAPTGYWTAAADGAVFAHGDAPFAGSRGGRPPPAPIVAVAATPSGDGYWLVSRRGDVYGFGDAPVLGSTAGGAGAGGPAGASRQAGADGQAGATGGPPVAGIATTVTGQGYWLAAADGAVSAFGDAAFLGSAAGSSLRAPVVGIAATPTGRGYWLVAADGGVFSYGDAGFFGSMGDRRLNQPVVGMAATQSGKGYWLVAADGSVFAFGAAGWFGSAGATRLAQPVVGIAAGAGGRGYTLVARDGGVFAYGDAPFLGSEAGRRLGGPIVGVALKG